MSGSFLMLHLIQFCGGVAGSYEQPGIHIQVHHLFSKGICLVLVCEDNIPLLKHFKNVLRVGSDFHDIGDSPGQICSFRNLEPQLVDQIGSKFPDLMHPA